MSFGYTHICMHAQRYAGVCVNACLYGICVSVSGGGGGGAGCKEAALFTNLPFRLLN